jgi:transketolase
MRLMNALPATASRLSPYTLEEHAHEARRLVLDQAIASGASHIGSSLSAVDLLSVLVHDVMRRSGPRPDRLLLSKGHAAMALYAVLATARVLDPRDVVASFARDGGRLHGHPERDAAPGIEMTGGSLGHGVAIGIGLALAAKWDGSDRRTFVVVGDGEMNEGSVWEAVALAGHLALGRFTVVVDANGLQGLGRTQDVLGLEPLATKLRAFHWDVVECDGHDHACLRAALARPQEKPLAVVARTVKGYGVDFMEDDVMWHYRSLTEADRDRVEQALARSRACRRR